MNNYGQSWPSYLKKPRCLQVQQPSHHHPTTPLKTGASLWKDQIYTLRLFVGPLRLNLDPLEEFSDSELHRVLAEVELADVVAHAGGLNALVAEDGQNWSAGQRQLICIARALLRQSKIVMLDEATASCDVNTDAMVQKVIRRVFADCTVLTIAHRIHTIADSTRIMVLSAGRVVEYDTPDNLMEQEDSIYRSLVEESEKSHQDQEDSTNTMD
eukprot:COSAG02_NODE_772_length_17359_cov_74.661587_19_plen_213_part_00